MAVAEVVGSEEAAMETADEVGEVAVAAPFSEGRHVLRDLCSLDHHTIRHRPWRRWIHPRQS